jgi:hypothetical protein
VRNYLEPLSEFFNGIPGVSHQAAESLIKKRRTDTFETIKGNYDMSFSAERWDQVLFAKALTRKISIRGDPSPWNI